MEFRGIIVVRASRLRLHGVWILRRKGQTRDSFGQVLPQGGQPCRVSGAHKDAWRLHAVNFEHVFKVQWPTVFFKGIEFVEHQELGDLSRANLCQYPLHLGNLLGIVFVGGINNMQQQICINRFLQCGLKSGN